MTYENREKKAHIAEMEKGIIGLYLSSKTFEEFMIEAKLEFPWAPRRFLDACRIQHFKNEHKILYYVLHLASSVLMAFLLTVASVASRSLNCAEQMDLASFITLSIMLWFPSSLMLGLMLKNALYGKVMRSIQWYEDGCPIDY